MSILDKANQLGLLISESEELINYRQAELDFLNDIELQTQYNEYRKLYDLYKKNSKEELANEIDLKYDNLMRTVKFKNYVECKEKFEKLIINVHELIDFYVGDERKSKDCNGCSGCSKK